MLSPSTEAFDLDEKFEDYKQLETLQEYILISQDKQQIECRRRTDTNNWETVIDQSEDCVFLGSINLEFAIAKLYRGLDEAKGNCYLQRLSIISNSLVHT